MKTGSTFRRSRSFALRILFAATVACTALPMAACADENDPATWVKRLDDPAQRTQAIKRLDQFYEDSMTNAGKKHDDPQVKKVLDVVVEPLTKTYTAGGLDDKSRKDLIKGLSDMRDPRAQPAFAKAFSEYEQGKTDDDVKFAAEAVGAMAKAGTKFDQPVIDGLWSCFTKYQPSKTNSIQGTQGLHDAVIAVKDPSYGDKAIVVLKAPVLIDDSPSSQGTKKVNDQLEFWQTTAIQVIGALKYTKGAKALVSVLMTKNKLGIAALAQAALLKMPNEAEPILAAALNGSDPDLARLQTDWDKDKGYVPIIANVLAYTSLDSARDALLAYIPSVDNDTNRAAIAQSLIWFPTTPRLVETFKALYAKLPPIATKGDSDTGSERAGLLQVTSEFFDPGLLTWTLAESAGAKGTNMLSAKVGAIQSAVKLMEPETKKNVEDAIGNLEKSGLSAKEKEAVVTNVRGVFKYAAEAVDKCNKDASCYLTVVQEPIAGTANANWKSIKAAHMCGVLGNEQTRKQLIANMGKITNPGARLAAAVAINHLAPKGDKADADALDKIVEGDNARKDTEALKGDDALVKVAQMLRARASQ
ncbi:MAG TPA: hypothetical protein VLM85_08785 [Polyangiaceae bacterium]|nr:hypothetical protein [Polyangiaceae bacterium]